MSKDLSIQALIFGRYLLKKVPSKKSQDLYVHIIQASDVAITAKELRLLSFTVRHPRLVGFIDSGLAISGSMSEVRRRIYVMLAVLECQPEYADKFLAKDQPWWYVFYILYVGLRSAIKATLGFILVKMVVSWP